MKCPPTGSPRPRVATSPRPARPRGFSFVEILFAVMILGIGFIMVAAIFPVAIQQTEANNQETVAASIGRFGTGILERVALGQVIYNNSVVPAMNPSSSILVPTFPARANARSSFVLTQQGVVTYFHSFTTTTPPSWVAVPGEVWSFFDGRDDYRAQLASGSPPVATTTTASHAAMLWSGISQNLVVPSDPRFGYVLMYRRDYIAHPPAATGGQPTFELAPYAQVIVIAVQARNKQVYSIYGKSADVITTGTTPPTLLPWLFNSVAFTRNNATGVTRVDFGGNANGPVAENAYVVISDDRFAVGDPRHVFNGRIFRVGNPINADTGSWELAPGNDLTQADAQLLNGRPLTADVLVVGRAVDPNTTGNPKQFTGLSQAVSAYTTYVQVP